MHKLPTFSIITPSYNCAAFIRQCIESVLEQGYPNFEHVIVDGGSQDGTVDILKEYPHLQWVSEPDSGESEALNKALRNVAGDIVGWLNADDYYMPGTLHRVAEEMKPKTGRRVVYGKTRFLGEQDEVVRISRPVREVTFGRLLWWCYGTDLSQPAMFYSAALVRELGGFREDLHFSVDYEYWLRVSRKFQFHFIDEVLATARELRRGCKSSASLDEQHRSHQAVAAPYLKLASKHERLIAFVAYWTYQFCRLSIVQAIRSRVRVRTRLNQRKDELLRSRNRPHGNS